MHAGFFRAGFLRNGSLRSAGSTGSLVRTPKATVLLVLWWLLSVCMTDSFAADWPHWRGPQRNGLAGETSGFSNKDWPGKPLWQVSTGEGSSSPLVIGGKLYVVGWRDGQDTLACLDAASGKTLWSQSWAAPRFGRKSNGDKGLYSAMCSTPEYDRETGLLYTLGIDGDLNCFDTAKAGARAWGFNLYEKYEVPQRPKVGRSGQRDYGYVSSPLVEGGWLLVEVGATTGNLIAFDRRTGKEVWKSACTDPPGHTGGPVPVRIEGVPCAVVHTFEGIVLTRLDGGHAGETVGTFPWKTSFANSIPSPTVAGNAVYVTSAYNQSRLARLDLSLAGIKLAWEAEGGSNVCSPVVFQDHVLFITGQLRCHDASTGQLKWQGGRYQAPASVIATSDGRLITWANRGDLTLMEGPRNSPDSYRELARTGPVFRTDVWPHVVLAGGRLYCRDRDGNLACFVIGEPG